jgi:hypothetical protein
MYKIFSGSLSVFLVAASIVSVSPAEARGPIIRHGGAGHAFAGHMGRGGGRHLYDRHGGGHYYAGRGGGGYYGDRGGYRHYGGWDGGYDDGDAIGAGIAGFAVGSIIAGAMHRQTSYGGSCQARFKSYDRANGTYFGYDGRRRPCP